MCWGAHVMDIGIRALWSPSPRVAGPAFTVMCAPGDNLMLHAAIYRAAPGSVLVVPADRREQALRDGQARASAEAAQTLDRWEAEHHARIERILAEHGFSAARMREAGQ
jgi:hypothetical protein